MITVLTGQSETQVEAEPGTSLWLNADYLEGATGWTLKPEGFCKDDICVPVPADGSETFARDDQVNVSAFWDLMGKPSASSAAGDIWYLGEDADSRNAELLSLQAPDFTLPDFEGHYHSLSDFQRKKVLLLTWASW